MSLMETDPDFCRLLIENARRLDAGMPAILSLWGDSLISSNSISSDLLEIQGRLIDLAGVCGLTPGTLCGGLGRGAITMGKCVIFVQRTVVHIEGPIGEAEWEPSHPHRKCRLYNKIELNGETVSVIDINRSDTMDEFLKHAEHIFRSN
jgi:hypothetical protein